MPFRPIKLTDQGDELALPEQESLYDELMEEQPVYRPQPKDLDALEIGDYTLEVMQPDDPDMIGSRMHRSKHFVTGEHKLCGGTFSLRRVSETHRVLACNGCFLRVAIPNAVHTYGDLREIHATKD